MTVHVRADSAAAPGSLAGDAQHSLTLSVEMVRVHLPEFDHVSVMVIDDAGRLRTCAQVGDTALDLDRLQHDLGEGPCVDSQRVVDAVVAPDLGHDRRWRSYVAAAAELGVRSQISIPLAWRDSTLLGVLNMYSTTRGDVAATAPVAARVHARQIAGAVACCKQVEQLHRALETRTSIGVALGLLMAQHQLTESAAFDVLRGRSSHTNVKLRDIAAHMVAEAESAGLELPAPAMC